jgi:Leucine-rich repeat (LRR) protein
MAQFDPFVDRVHRQFFRNPLLSGTIPSDIGNLPNLIEIWFNENQLTGSIPSNIGRLRLLQQL